MVCSYHNPTFKHNKIKRLAAEEAEMGSGKAVKSKISNTKKKKGSKKKNDLSLLEDALIGDAEQKNKAKKKMERIKREREAAAKAERERKANVEQKAKDPLLANTDSMIGDFDEDDNYIGGAVGRAANVASMTEVQASGVDSAISALSIGGGGDDRHPEKRLKAAYRAYEEKMMPEMKQQYPGLKRQQYLDKIFSSWKKSPENPLNQQQ